MKKIYIGIVMLIIFVCGFAFSWILFRGKNEENRYSIVKDMEKFSEILLDETTEYIVLDLRKSEDFEKSHLNNAINIPYKEETFIQELSQAEMKDVPIYLICYSGKMASMAFNQMVKEGINNVHYVTFGFDDYLDFVVPDNSATKIEIAYQDMFPSLNLEEGEKDVITVCRNFEYTLVAYISNECVSCQEALSDISILNAIKDDSFEIVLLWKNSMPTDLLNNYNLMENSASLNNKIKLSDITPSYFLLDKEGRVVFVEKGNCRNVTNKLFEMGIYSEEKNMGAVLKYLKNYIKQERETFLLFTTENCAACDDIMLKIETDTQFANKNMIYICTQKENTEFQKENSIKDQYGIIGKIFNIKGYPTLYLQTQTDGEFNLYCYE